ncbi:ring-1,2-phenylacetyl-CoA epoxidase subunit PaaB [Deinobacterium chartae]|uniref:Ring-1,2-phenylacetyl-CoA epoxidase subunit PaaB n=1 Tax=Deinobacterium chartae TaxID=521158 RepID=A0A841I1U5_9DEIO|nr:phenylacetic acid degradation protein [Deinobacterium chartae]MBB6098288.1 ring-1,2-phenylacetyl-CoA epoxidase subunit PaaB [Deinobacterium chartae]
MMDTQWPRWEVFKQDAPGKPHQAVGSVHATDPQHALVTARTVFVRRPSAVSLWVVPARVILARTAEELVTEGELPATEPEAAAPQRYLVFRKTNHRRSMTFVDYALTLEAASPEAALRRAREHFAHSPTLVWWIVPEAAITRSDESPETVESWFAPARDKTYRQQSSYGVVGSHISKHKQRPQGAERD